ncbi:MAG: sodium:proton antiporter [Chloroflexi bacterium]|nr:sodium:proton antiporter [Chloroflexota bacterium]
MHHSILFELASIVVLGVGAQWVAWRFELPSILLLLLIGFAAGPVTGLINPDALLGDLLQPVVSLSVAIILFEGGLSLKIDELREGGVVRNLVSVGLLVTWAISSAAALVFLDLDLALSLLLGAIVVVSGPTVIIPMLRHLRLGGEVGSILKWEGILIDPIGATFAVLVFEAVFVADELQEATISALLGLFETLMVGGVAGVAGAIILTIALRRYWVPDFLESPVTLMLVVAVFDLSDEIIPESGLFAVTVMGLIVANQKDLQLGGIEEFKESVGILLISSLFILLAARLDLEDFEHVGLGSLIFLATLIVVARPITVLVSTWGSQLNWRERVFLAWMAPRGIVAAAVASIFALDLEEVGHPDAERLVPLTFLVIVGTVAFYALTTQFVARRLKLVRPQPQGVLIAGAHSWARNVASALQNNGIEVLIVDTNPSNIALAEIRNLPNFRENILTQRCLEEAEVCGVGRLMALTSNDEVNSLAALQFTELFGRQEVYRLPANIAADKTTRFRYGRTLFNEEMTHQHITSLFNAGATLEKTDLESEADITDFQRQLAAGNRIPLFSISNGTLNIITADNPIVPRIGQRIIYLTDPTAGNTEVETQSPGGQISRV